MAVSTIDALYNGTSEKLTTSATGITVTGTVAATAYTGDGSALTGTGSPSIVDNGNATAITIDSDETVIVNRSTAIANDFSINMVGKSSGGIIIQPAADSNFEAMRVVNHGLTAAIGSIRVAGGDDLAIAGGATGIRFDSDEAKIYPTDGNGDVSNGALSIGDPSFRFKNAYLSGAIYLGGAVSANALDDYEEGTWTPSWVSVSGGTLSSYYTGGRYTKIGRMVYISGYLSHGSMSGVSSSSQMKVGSLPFTSSSSGFGQSGIYNGGISVNQRSLWDSDGPAKGTIFVNSTQIELTDGNPTTQSVIRYSNFRTNSNYSQLVFFGQYHV
jgi:3D (Asp-Asp-Asp) domain-containing protein